MLNTLLVRRLMFASAAVTAVITLLYQLGGNPRGTGIWAAVTLGQLTLLLLLGDPWTQTALTRLGALIASYPLDQDRVDVRMLVAFFGLTLQIVLPVIAAVCLGLEIYAAGAIFLAWAFFTHLAVRASLRSMERSLRKTCTRTHQRI